MLNLVTTCDLATILQRPFFDLLHKIIQFSDIMRFSHSFCRDKNVTKSTLKYHFSGNTSVFVFITELSDALIDYPYLTE